MNNFAIIIVNDHQQYQKNPFFNILLTKDKKLFNSLDPLYLDLIKTKTQTQTQTQTQPQTQKYIKTFREGIYWVQIRNNDETSKSAINQLSDQFLIINDDFKQPLDYLLSNEYNIQDPETRHWLDKFQNMFIGYQPDIYENISQDSYS